MSDHRAQITANQATITNALKTASETPGEDILDNLTSRPRSIPSKFFYDSRGSRLFEKITELPEYYIPEKEKNLLEKIAPELRAELEGADVIELGSGGPQKVMTFLRAAFPVASAPQINRYIPIDISKSALEKSAEKLEDEFSNVEFHGLVADFVTQLDRLPAGRKRIFCFFGSTIGNFSRSKQKNYLKNLAGEMNRGDSLLLGVDRVKKREKLERAYNDCRGITARFNRNILLVANKYAGTDFQLEDFSHSAPYKEDKHRIEMHLRAKKGVTVSTPKISQEIEINGGETIHTENSHKFTGEHIEEFDGIGNLDLENVYSDKKQWFSLLHFKK